MFGPLVGRQWRRRAIVQGTNGPPPRFWVTLATLAFAFITAASIADFMAIKASRDRDQSELLLQQCETLADTLDLEVAHATAILHGLAVSTPMTNGDMTGLATEMRQASGKGTASIYLVDREGQVLSSAMSAAVPAAPSRVRVPEVLEAIDAAEPRLTNLFRSSSYLSNRLAVVYPLSGSNPGEAHRGALIFSISPNELIALLSARHWPRLTSVRFIDRNGVVAASTDVPDQAGQPASPQMLSALAGQDQGTAAVSGENGGLFMAWAKAPLSKFAVTIIAPPPAILPTLGQALWPVLGVPLLCLCARPFGMLVRGRVRSDSLPEAELAVSTLPDNVPAPLALDETAIAQVEHTPARRDTVRDQTLHAHRLEVMGTLASGVAHDFGNVLQVLDGSLRIIRDNPNDTATVQHSTEIMLDVLGGARSVVRRLLSFAREEALDTADCDVAVTLGGIVEILRHTFPRQIAIALDVPADLPGMHVDKPRLEAALLNVATNAKHAMPSGGTLTLSASLEASPQIGPDATNRLKGDFIRIDATDSGVGMSAATLARATEAFFTTKPAGQGTGLGLSATRSFAEESGGALWLASQLGKGTTVSLWLPRAAQTIDGSSPASTAVPASLPLAPLPLPQPAANLATLVVPPVNCDAMVIPPRVLLVDDEPMIRDVLARQLGRRGINVLACLDAAAAVAALAGPQEFDLLLTDFAMPDMPGDVLIARARALRPGLPVIVLTGHPHDAEVLGERTSDSSMRLLSKPISGRELADEIDSMLGRVPSA
jgi:signal transduction histidine kinase/CheY-like chemotaxis protein